MIRVCGHCGRVTGYRHCPHCGRDSGTGWLFSRRRKVPLAVAASVPPQGGEVKLEARPRMTNGLAAAWRRPGAAWRRIWRGCRRGCFAGGRRLNAATGSLGLARLGRADLAAGRDVVLAEVAGGRLP